MTGANVMRVVVGAVGIGMLLLGVLLALSFFGTGGIFAGFWLIVAGIAVIIGVAVEVSRYRSQAAENLGLRPGPGGGETTALESRFRPTEEVFVDPTSNRRMRVYMDANTGERRYVAEG